MHAGTFLGGAWGRGQVFVLAFQGFRPGFPGIRDIRDFRDFGSFKCLVACQCVAS